MTSEICVLNRRALVLAADSAVTVTRWENGKKEERYFKGANKIFQLSAFQPVGLMIFDTADLHRLPWEIVVKEFRDYLGRTKCGKLENYASEFFSFIVGHKGLFSDDYRKEIFVELVDQGMIQNLQYIMSHNKVTGAGDDKAALQGAILDVFNGIRDVLRSNAPKVPITQEKITALVRKYRDELVREAELDLKLFANGAKIPKDDLIEVGANAVFCVPDTFLATTGVVVAGYGDDDYFPSYESYNCFGLIDDEIVVTKTGDFAITPKAQGHINAFATTAMVDTFTLGFGPDVLRSVRTCLEPALQAFAEKVCAAVGAAAVPQNLAELVNDTVSEHRDKWTGAVVERHAQPFRRVIGSLPIDEMASLAETLVMLESLKEKVTQPSESVGGPIDVAIITKGEGFVWAKRKHFFDPNLNPRFFLRQREQYGRLEVRGETE